MAKILHQLRCSWDNSKTRYDNIASHTVDGRNPAPPDMYVILQIMGYLPCQLVSQISSINSITMVKVAVFVNNPWVSCQTESRSNPKSNPIEGPEGL